MLEAVLTGGGGSEGIDLRCFRLTFATPELHVKVSAPFACTVRSNGGKCAGFSICDVGSAPGVRKAATLRRWQARFLDVSLWCPIC